jgi:hypothetical protein
MPSKRQTTFDKIVSSPEFWAGVAIAVSIVLAAIIQRL